MKISKNFVRVIALILTLAFCLAFLGSGVLLSTQAASLSSLEQKYDQMEAQLKKLKQAMTKTKNEKEKQLQYKEQIDEEIDLTQRQIDNLNSQIKALGEDIAENEKQLINKENEISENDELFKTRMRAMYMTTDNSVLSLVFGAQSFSEFLQNTEYMKRIANNDKELIEQLRVDKQEILDTKAKIQASKKKVETNKTKMDTKKKDLEYQYKKSQNLLSTLSKDEKALKQQQIELNKEMEQLDKEIQKLIKELQSGDAYVGGTFQWPMPGYSTITSSFGWRTLYGVPNNHTGTDISGANIYGKNIVAANSGTVIKVVTTYVPKKGYGKYLIIDHGGGYSTLYAHCSSLSVTTGQTVKKGQVVAQVGSTGNSTGPHLHFEIRINGKAVDPMSYFKKA